MDESLVDVKKELTERGASNDDQATQNIAINKHFGRLSFRTLDFEQINMQALKKKVERADSGLWCQPDTTGHSLSKIAQIAQNCSPQ